MRLQRNDEGELADQLRPLYGFACAQQGGIQVRGRCQRLGFCAASEHTSSAGRKIIRKFQIERVLFYDLESVEFFAIGADLTEFKFLSVHFDGAKEFWSAMYLSVKICHFSGVACNSGL